MHTGSRERGQDYCLAVHGDKLFAVPVAGLVRVIARADCDLQENLPSPLLGWATGDGARFPVAPLAHWLDGLVAEPSQGEHVVVVDTGAGWLGLALDNVRGITTILETEIRIPPSSVAAVVSGLWSQRLNTIHILAPEQLAADARRLNEAAGDAPPAATAPATPASGTARGYCFFERRGRHFAVPILAAREVIADEPVTPVPQAPQHVLGVINLRGNLLPLINVDSFLGLPASVTPASYEALVVESDGVLLGLFVDRVGDVRPIEVLEVRTTPGMEQPGSIYNGVWSSPDADVFLVDVGAIVAQAVDATTRTFQRTVAALSGLEEDADAVADTPF